MNTTNGQPHESTQKEREKNPISLLLVKPSGTISYCLDLLPHDGGKSVEEGRSRIKKRKYCIPQPYIYKNKSKLVLFFISSPGTTLFDNAEINNFTLKMCGQPLHSK